MHRHSRLAALMLAGIIGIGGPVANLPGLSFDSWAGYEKVNGVYQMLDGTAIEGVHARGIDVSQWQGVIDWMRSLQMTFSLLCWEPDIPEP